MLRNPSDLTSVDDLLTTLANNDGLVGDVADTLAYAWSDASLLGTITDTFTESLLGISQPGDGMFQTIKLIFITDAVAPVGVIGIELSSGATLAVGQNSDFDNVVIERFGLGTNGGFSVAVRAASQGPTLKVKGKRYGMGCHEMDSRSRK